MLTEQMSPKSMRHAVPLVTFVACLTVPQVTMAQASPTAAASNPQPAASSASSAVVSTGLFPEPGLLRKGVRFAVDKLGDGTRSKEGFFLEMSNMVTGSGFLSVGPGYRHFFWDRQAFVETSGAVSWHFYKMAQGRFEMPALANNHLVVGSQLMWQDQTQVKYFGTGPDSSQDDESQYRLKHTDIVGYAIARPREWLAVGGELGWLHQPELLPASGTFRSDLPNASVTFPNDPGMSPSEQPSYLHGETSITADTRDYRGHPTEGGLYRAALTSYTNEGNGAFSFRQYEAEAAHFLPFADHNLVLGFRGWIVVSDVPGGHEIPFYLLPSLGGHSTLRAYSNFRFHDRNLAVVTAESRWAIFEHVDAAVFFDAGNVAHRAGDLNLRKTDYGAGLRLHTGRTTVALLDVAQGTEGWKFVLRTSDPFRLSRLTRRVAAIPFAP